MATQVNEWCFRLRCLMGGKLLVGWLVEVATEGAELGCTVERRAAEREHFKVWRLTSDWLGRGKVAHRDWTERERRGERKKSGNSRQAHKDSPELPLSLITEWWCVLIEVPNYDFTPACSSQKQSGRLFHLETRLQHRCRPSCWLAFLALYSTFFISSSVTLTKKSSRDDFLCIFFLATPS